jgi:hypothetical protein
MQEPAAWAGKKRSNSNPELPANCGVASAVVLAQSRFSFILAGPRNASTVLDARCEDVIIALSPRASRSADNNR